MYNMFIHKKIKHNILSEQAGAKLQQKEIFSEKGREVRSMR